MQLRLVSASLVHVKMNINVKNYVETDPWNCYIHLCIGKYQVA